MTARTGARELIDTVLLHAGRVLKFIIIHVKYNKLRFSHKALILFVLLMCFNDAKSNGGVEFRWSYGFIVRHHMDMGIYTKPHFPAFELNYFSSVNGTKSWHHDHNMPDKGVSLIYSELGNSDILGNVTALVPWIKLPIIKTARYGIFFKIGGGFGYFNKKFDADRNYKNLAIGSHINACINPGAEVRASICKSLTLSAGLGWMHFSNGTMISPNYGINMPNVNIGLAFNIGKRTTVHSKVLDSTDFRMKGFNFSISSGIKQILPLEGPYYSVVSASLSYARPVKRNGTVSLSFDISNDQSDKPLLKREGKDAGGSLGLIKTGISAGIGTQFGRTSISFMLGAYLSGKETSDGSVYDKLGIDYHVNKSVSVILYLKTHYAKADYIGCGLKFKIPDHF